MSVSTEVAAAVVIAERRSARNGCPERQRVCLLRRLCMSSCIMRLLHVHAIVVWLARREGRVRSIPRHRQPLMHRRRHTCRRRHGNCPELMAVDRRRHRHGMMVAQAVRVSVMMRVRHVSIHPVLLLPLLALLLLPLLLLHARHLLAPRPHLRLGVALPVHAGVAGLVRRHTQRMRMRVSVVLRRLVSCVAR